MELSIFAELIAIKARRKGFRIKTLSIIQGMGFSQETPYNILHFLKKFNFITFDNKSVHLTMMGEKFFDYVFKIAFLVKEKSIGFENDTGKVIGNVLYALTDWRQRFSSSIEILAYVDKLWSTIKELEKRDDSIYSYFLFLLPRYYFEEYDDPITLLEKLKKYMK